MTTKTSPLLLLKFNKPFAKLSKYPPNLFLTNLLYELFILLILTVMVIFMPSVIGQLHFHCFVHGGKETS